MDGDDAVREFGTDLARAAVAVVSPSEVSLLTKSPRSTGATRLRLSQSTDGMSSSGSASTSRFWLPTPSRSQSPLDST